MRWLADQTVAQSDVRGRDPFDEPERTSVFKALSDVAAALRTTTGNDLKFRPDGVTTTQAAQAHSSGPPKKRLQPWSRTCARDSGYCSAKCG